MTRSKKYNSKKYNSKKYNSKKYNSKKSNSEKSNSKKSNSEKHSKKIVFGPRFEPSDANNFCFFNPDTREFDIRYLIFNEFLADRLHTGFEDQILKLHPSSVYYPYEHFVGNQTELDYVYKYAILILAFSDDLSEAERERCDQLLEMMCDGRLPCSNITLSD